MAKAVIELGWTKYVLDADMALTIAKALAEAEQFEQVYISREDRAHEDAPDHAYYIWKDASTEKFSFQLISDGVYQMGKLAGRKPKSN